MALAPTNLIRRTTWLQWTGSRYKLWMTFNWDENEPSSSRYIIDRHNMSTDTWEQIGEIQMGQRFFSFHVGDHGPPGWAYIQNYDKVRVTCHTIPEDGLPGEIELTFGFPTSRQRFGLENVEIQVPESHSGLCFMTISGTDDTHYLYCASLTVYNMTQNTREIYHRGINTGDPALAENYCDHRHPIIGFNLGGNLVPNEGDHIQFHYYGVAGNGKYPSNLDNQVDGTQTIRGIDFYAPVNFPFLSISATKNNPISYPLRYAPGISGSPAMATFSATGLPPGITCSSSGVLSGTPTTIGTWQVAVTTSTVNGDPGGGIVQIVVSESQLPVIVGPFNSVVLYQNVPITPWTFVATHNPSSFAVAAGSTLPPGLSLNTSTGKVTGTPTTLQSATVCNFTATNVTGTGPSFPLTITVTTLPLPSVTSPTTATGYRGEAFSYQITATGQPFAFTADPLPVGLLLNAATGLISGTIDPVNLPQVFPISLRAQNLTGYSAPVILSLTIADRIPVITSDLTQSAIAFQPYTYAITATAYPISFGAANLPFGLGIDTETGIISGVPAARGTYSITISATNSAGTGSAVLVLIVRLERPVIDISITSGKAITCETGIPIVFQPVASNGPTGWIYAPALDGFLFDSNTGRLSGTFTTVGLYGEIFYATNVAGLSDPAIFYFLVELGTGSAATLGDGLDLWIDVQDGGVSIMVPGATMEQTITQTENGTTVESKKTIPVPSEKAVLWSKRGDTLPLTIRFHKSGKPVTVRGLSSLKFGVREDFALPYAVLTNGFIQNEDGSFSIYPNYANNPEIDFEIDDTEEFIELLAEVQWEVGSQDPFSDPPFARRSSQTFKNRVYRDVIYPDDSQL